MEVITQDRTVKPAWYLKRQKEVDDLKRHAFPCMGVLKEFPAQDMYDGIRMLLICGRCAEVISEE